MENHSLSQAIKSKELPYQNLLSRLEEALDSINNKVSDFLVNISEVLPETNEPIKSNFETALSRLVVKAEDMAKGIKI